MFCRLANQIKAGKKGTSHQKCEASLCGTGLVDPVRINSIKKKILVNPQNHALSSLLSQIEIFHSRVFDSL